jgi:hypothetical protein
VNGTNYLTASFDAGGDDSCRSCGLAVSRVANFCEHCGELQPHVGPTIETLVTLHRNGHVDDTEYLTALDIQRGTHQPVIVVVAPRRQIRARARTRIRNEIAALAIVGVAIVGLSVGYLQTKPNINTPGRYTAPALLVPGLSGEGWNLAAPLDPRQHLEALDQYWAANTTRTYRPAEMILERGVDLIPADCKPLTGSAAVYWCVATDSIIYDKRALAELTATGGDGLTAAILAQVSAERAHRRVDPRLRACRAGVYLAELAATNPGDAALALLRSHSATPHPERAPIGRIDLALASYEGFRSGIDACQDARTAIDNRLNGDRSAMTRSSDAAAGAVTAATEAFLGIARATVTPEDVQPDLCPVPGRYTNLCGTRISYDELLLATLTRRYGSFAGSSPAVLTYTELQQNASNSRTGLRGQYCGLGAAARQVQRTNELYGTPLNPQMVVLANLDPVLDLLAWESVEGHAAYGALDAVATGFTRGAGACL